MVQVNHSPTRLENILDLVCTTNPDLVTKTEVLPGMSDHKIILTNVNIKATIPKRKKREVYQYKKGDIEMIREDLVKL